MSFQLKSDSKSIRALILYDVVKKKDMTKSYNEFFFYLGPDFMDYPQFEHYFRRYEGGEVDLDYEGCPTELHDFSTLPDKFWNAVLKKLPLKDQWTLGGTSSSLRKKVLPKFPGCTEIEILMKKWEGSMKLKLIGMEDPFKIGYSQMKNFQDKVKVSFKKNQTASESGSLVDLMFRDLRFLMENPKTKLEKLILEERLEQGDGCKERQLFSKNLEALQASQLQFQTKEVEIKIWKGVHAAQILKLMKPGALKKISLQVMDKWTIDEVASMAQWKMARNVVLDGFRVPVALRDICHLSEFKGHFNYLKPEYVAGLKREMTRESSVMKKVTIRFFQGGLDRMFAATCFGPPNQFNGDTDNQRNLLIPGSEEYVRVKIEANSVEFTRAA